jgi:adenine deaminase
MVFARGVLVARDGRLTEIGERGVRASGTVEGRNTVRLQPPPAERFRIAAPDGRAKVRVRVMEMNQTNSFTRAGEATLAVRDGIVAWESSDLCLGAVFERHGRAGTVGYGFIRDALRGGAMATTWAHDSHNLFVLGRSADEMAAAARWVVERGGGIAAVRGEHVLAGVPLPVAGIISDAPVAEVGRQVAALRAALERLGFVHRSPIMTLGVLTLAVSPELKLTDLGLVDVNRGRLVSLYM